MLSAKEGREISKAIPLESFYKLSYNDNGNERVTGRKARGSPNGGKRLQVPHSFLSLKHQEETNQKYFFLLYTNLKGGFS